MATPSDFLEALHDLASLYSSKVEAVEDRQLNSEFISFARTIGDVHLLVHPNEQYVQVPGAISLSASGFSDDDSKELIIRTAAYIPGSNDIPGTDDEFAFVGPFLDGYEQLNEYTQLRKTERENKYTLLFTIPIFTLYDSRPFPDRVDWLSKFFTSLDMAIDRINAGDVATVSIMDSMTEEQLEARGLRNTYSIINNSINDLESRSGQLEMELASAQDNAMSYAQRLAEIRQQINAFDPSAGMIQLSSIKHPLIENIISKLERSSGIWYIEIITKEVHMMPNANPENLPIPDEGISIGQVLCKLTISSGESNPFRFKQYGAANIGVRRGTAVHPHVLSGAKPCLGSFGDTVIDAISKADLETLVDVMFIFLQSANTEDSAGRNWPKWLSNDYSSVGSNQQHTPTYPTDETEAA